MKNSNVPAGSTVMYVERLFSQQVFNNTYSICKEVIVDTYTVRIFMHYSYESPRLCNHDVVSPVLTVV